MIKNKRFKGSLCIVLVLIMISAVTGCAARTGSKEIEPMEIEEPDKYSFDFIGGSDVMPIMGFLGPDKWVYSYMGNDQPDFVSDEYFQAVADSGINIISSTGLDFKNNSEKVYKMLELGEKYGVGITVSDSRIIDNNTKRVQVETVEQLDALLSYYSDYPAFVASHIIDEPGQEGFFVANPEDPVLIKDFGELFDMFALLNICTYGNLLSNLTQTQERYAEYIQEWIDTAKLPYLQYDQYLFDGGVGLDYALGWFETITTIRTKAEEAKIPFWVFVQTGAQWNDGFLYFDSDSYWPSQGEFRWNVGAALAFGAKGINYFPLTQPMHYAYAESTFFDFERNGMIGAWGNKNRWYYYAQEMNAQIAAVDHILMNAVNKGIIVSGKEATEDLSGNKYLLEGTSWRELSDVEGDTLIGCFNYLGKTALYVLNYDSEYAQKINLKFVDNYEVTVIQDAEERKVSGDNLELTLSAGNSALIIFE